MICLGGFIITHYRPKILLETTQILFKQTQPLELLWIIDNSDNLETDHAIVSLLDPRLNYYRMGYNFGPAGAAAKGLALCGHFFGHKKGERKRIQSKLLERKTSVEVEVIAGGMSMLVHRDVVKAGIFPNPDLFFGFEELDFCLKAKRRGFTMLVHCGLFLALRAKHNRTDFERPLYKRKSNLVREYYSLRNLLYISNELTLNVMKKRLVRKWIGKSFYGFRYGLWYGFKNFRMIWLAFYHYRLGVKGKTIDL